MADHAAIYRELDQRGRRTLITPEGVALSLRLADAGQRFSAFLIDFLLMFAILIVATLVIVLGAFASGPMGVRLLAVIWLIGAFLLRNFYFIFMEMRPRAATFGKRILGLRVVARNGERLTADAVIARNLMREIEVYLPLSFLGANAASGSGSGLATLFGLAWASIFLFFPLFNRDRLRVGDLLAGTWVINAPKRALGLDLLHGRQHDAASKPSFTNEQLDVYGQFELQTLEQVLRQAKPDAMAAVADSIRTKINLWDNISDADFLNAYYQALRLRLERKLLFGKRRLDKFDR